MQTVGQVATATGVSVRTLHHWEQVGLVTPVGRGTNGYRSYDDSDVARVRTVVAWRGLGLSLDDIRVLLESGVSTDVLQERLELLDTEAARLARMRAAVVRA